MRSNERFFTPYRLACLSIILAAIVPFAGSLAGLAVWDDHFLVGGYGHGSASLIGAFTQPFLGGYFRPVVGLSYFLDGLAWGQNVFGYHQTNLLIHAITAGMVISLLWVITNDRRIALLGGFLFAIHPVHASPAGWIGGRTDSLACLFAVAFAHCLIVHVRSNAPTAGRLLAMSAIAFTLAMMCKEQLILLILLVPVAFHIHGTRRPLLGECALFAIPIVAFVAAWLTVAPPRTDGTAYGVIVTAGHAGLSVFHYASLLTFPSWANLHTFTLGPIRAYGASVPAIGIGIGFLFLWFAILGIRRKSPVGWWAAWLILVIAPCCNIIPMSTLPIAPYRAELATVPFSALIACAAVAIWDLMTSPKMRLVPLAMGAAIASFWLLLCINGTVSWRSDEQLFSALSKTDPEFLLAHYELAGVLLDRGSAPQAVSALESLLKRLAKGESWHDPIVAAQIMSSQGPLARRILEEQSGRIMPNVWFARLYSELGQAKMSLSDLPGAESAYSMALGLDNKSYDAATGLGRCWMAGKKPERALESFCLACSLDANRMEARAMRGRVYVELGDWRSARKDFAVWSARQPESADASLELASADLHIGRAASARHTLETALIHSPDRRDLQDMLRSIVIQFRHVSQGPR